MSVTPAATPRALEFGLLRSRRSAVGRQSARTMSTFKVAVTIFWAVTAADVLVGNYRIANGAAKLIDSMTWFTANGAAEEALIDRCDGSAALLLCRRAESRP